MGLLLYLVAAAAIVLAIAWALYVAPTAGPLSPVELLVALTPSFSLIALMLVAVLVVWTLGKIWRLVARWRRR